MKVSSLIARIETTAPPSYAASWDRSGVQIAGTRQDIRRMAVCLDPTLKNIEKAVEEDADFILCHHPLTLSPRLPDRIDDYHHILRAILGRGCWLYAAHTSLDAQPRGPVSWLAQELCLQKTQVLQPTGFQDTQSGSEYGFGCVGDLQAPLSALEFHDLITKKFQLPVKAQTAPLPERIRRIAYCPGSGADLAEKAFAAGADIYITGDLKYHQAQDAEIVIMDVGHFSLEERMMEVWESELHQDLASQEIETFFIPGKDPLLP